MSKRTITSLISAAFVLLYILFQSFQSPQAPPIATSSASIRLDATQSGQMVQVVRVVDGDTIEIETGERVRYIGINTPETVDPRRPIQCYGHEGSIRNKELVENKTVLLEKDVSDKDAYGRLLRYVWLDGIMINEVLVLDGFAQVSTYPPDVKYKDRFIEAQRLAKEAKKGLWGIACR